MFFRRRKILTPFEKFKRRFIITVILFVILSFITTRAYFSETVRTYAANRATLQMSVIINEAISREIVPNIQAEELIHMKLNTEGQVTDVFIDVYRINLLLTNMTREIQERLIHQIHEEKLSLPLGVMFGHPWFSAMGPKVPIQIEMVGNVLSDIVTRTELYGINNTLMEVNIRTEINFLVMIPFQRQEIQVVTNTPLVINMIQGEVPRYYYSSRENGEFIHPPFGGS